MFDMVTAVETHYFWLNLISDMKEILRVLKPDGKLVIIGEAYKRGKNDEQIKKWMESGSMTNQSCEELHQLFSTAGFSEVQVFDDYNRGWICGIGRKTGQVA